MSIVHVWEYLSTKCLLENVYKMHVWEYLPEDAATRTDPDPAWLDRPSGPFPQPEEAQPRPPTQSLSRWTRWMQRRGLNRRSGRQRRRGRQRGRGGQRWRGRRGSAGGRGGAGGRVGAGGRGGAGGRVGAGGRDSACGTGGHGGAGGRCGTGGRGGYPDGPYHNSRNISKRGRWHENQKVVSGLCQFFLLLFFRHILCVCWDFINTNLFFCLITHLRS